MSVGRAFAGVAVCTTALAALLPSACFGLETSTPLPMDHVGVGIGVNDQGSITVSADHDGGGVGGPVAPKTPPRHVVQHGGASASPASADTVGCVYDPNIPRGGLVCDVVPTPRPGIDVSPAPPASTAATPPSEQSVALDYFRSLALPAPRPEISAPNGGICGVVHSLDLHMDPEAIYTDPDTAFGPLVVHVFANTTVDWGDGTQDTFSDTTGAPWPHSTISHFWNISGRYDINVSVTWSANWSFGQSSGIATGYRTTGAITNWPVYELQAVITS